MINPDTGRMQARKVDVNGEGYECARRYMIRLDRRDFDSPQRLARLAAVVNMTAEEFRQRFEYLVTQPSREGVRAASS
jgi:6-phosphofructokinase 1